MENNADLIRSECEQMISSKDVVALRLMFSLLDRLSPRSDSAQVRHRAGAPQSGSGVTPILTALENDVFETGSSGLKNEINIKDGDAVVTFLLDHLEEMNQTINQAFADDDRFTTARDKVIPAAK